MTDTYTPLGYHHHITYDSNDYGLPIEVQGDAITQLDGTTRQPTQTFGYDTYGNLTSSNKGNGATTFAYDGLNRLVTSTDPDSPNYVSYRYYNPDGSVSKTETPYQHATGTGSTIVYDADGNVVKSLAYRMTTYNSTAAQYPTNNWYDGEDRLVEVQQPRDPSNDAFANAWTTRYSTTLARVTALR